MSHEWLEKRSLRSVDQLRLWSDNPRLAPDEEHLRISDYVADLIEEPSEKTAFIDLIKSIARNGYIPADPIVVWKNEENDKYYVAEGNRRILALKLLRNADKAPKSIRSIVKQAAKTIDTNDLSKIRVAVAPSFEACEWYINQRHANNTLQRRWSRLQQQRWIAELYDKYDRNIDKVQSATNLTKGELDSTLRILKIRDMATRPEVLSQLNTFEKEKVNSHRIPMTILERWFTNTKVREMWGISYNEDQVEISSELSSFYDAYAALIKLIIHRKDPAVTPKVDTRTIDSNVAQILESLPKVLITEDDNKKPSVTNIDEVLAENLSDKEKEPKEEETKATEEPEPASELEVDESNLKHNNTKRNRLVLSTGQLVTQNSRLDALYNELKEVPVHRYPNCSAVALRVFLDLAVTDFIKTNGLVEEIESKFNNKKKLRDIDLRSRLEYLKQTKFKQKEDAVKVIKKLINIENEYSLDTLNNYVHGQTTHLSGKEFLNGFWDFLFPLFEELINIKA